MHCIWNWLTEDIDRSAVVRDWVLAILAAVGLFLAIWRSRIEDLASLVRHRHREHPLCEMHLWVANW